MQARVPYNFLRCQIGIAIERRTSQKTLALKTPIAAESSPESPKPLDEFQITNQP